MLSRYSMIRGQSLGDLPKKLRDGVRQDSRKHTRHCLRPAKDDVEAFLADPENKDNWRHFEKRYAKVVGERFDEDRPPFDKLAELARTSDVFIGCSCPTSKNRDVRRCHTQLALRFMSKRYPDLDVRSSGRADDIHPGA
ncbi:MAG: hypothetical protein AAF517_18405 [Planctomycetota bacterium]